MYASSPGTRGPEIDLLEACTWTIRGREGERLREVRERRVYDVLSLSLSAIAPVTFLFLSLRRSHARTCCRVYRKISERERDSLERGGRERKAGYVPR